MKKYIISGIAFLIGLSLFPSVYGQVLGTALRVFEIRQGGTGTSTAPSANGQFLIASGTDWMVGTFVAGSNVTITTSTRGQVTIASTGGGGGSSSSINGAESPFTFTTSGIFGFTITTSSQTVTFSQATSSATQAGFLQPADWITFNSKVSSSTQVIAGSGLTGGGALTGNVTLNASNSIPLARISGSTYSSIQHLFNFSLSSGISSGGEITDAGSGNASVAAGTGFIKSADSDIAIIHFFDWGASSTVAIPASSTRYIGVEYNAGSPQVVSKTTEDWDYDTEFPLGVVTREGDVLYITNYPWATADAMTNVIERFDSEFGVDRDERTGGLIISNTGTRNVAVTAGGLLARLSEFSIGAIDTSNATTSGFTPYYRDGSGGFTLEATSTAWNNSQYDDGDGGLASITALAYTSRWFYLMTDGSLAMLYGQSQDLDFSDILNESPPSSVPDRILRQGLLIGRFIIQASASSPTRVQTAFGTPFTSAVVTSHTNLSDLSWTSSGHTGTSSTIATFNGTGAASVTAVLPIGNGGTGSAVSSTARANLGVPILCNFTLENATTTAIDGVEGTATCIVRTTSTITNVLAVNTRTGDTFTFNLIHDINRSGSEASAWHAFSASQTVTATTTPVSLTPNASTTVRALSTLRIHYTAASSTQSNISIYMTEN